MEQFCVNVSFLVEVSRVLLSPSVQGCPYSLLQMGLTGMCTVACKAHECIGEQQMKRQMGHIREITFNPFSSPSKEITNKQCQPKKRY